MTNDNAMGPLDNNKHDMAQEIEYRSQIIGTLNRSQWQLERFLDISEDDFLTIGGKLRDYQNHSTSINDLSKNIIRIIGTDILTAGINKLSNLFETIGAHFVVAQETISKDRTDLEIILGKLSDIEESLGGFDKIVKTLRMLGIASKIESARLNLMDGGFFLLAETVDKMSTQIGDKKKEILHRSKSLLQQLARSLSDLSGLADEQKKQNTSFHTSTTISLETFKQKNLVCAASIGEIKEIGTVLTNNLMSIVQSIQFHDITRQQLQHVVEALIEMQHKLSEESNNDAELFSHVHDNLELQVRQLNGTLQNFISSVISIIDSLGDVETGTEQLFDHSRKIIGADSKESSAHHDMFERDLIFITEGLQKSLSIDKNLDASIAEIVSIVTVLADQIDSIEEVGTEIELVALNARVKAAHLGIDGAALGVLAEAIQKLSFEAKKQTAQTFQALMTIDKLSSQLRSELRSSRHETTNHLLQTTIEELNLLVASIKLVEQKALQETKQLDEVVHQFKNEIEKTVENVSIHTTAQESLNPLISVFNDITSEIKSRYGIVSRRESNTKHNIGKYTMMSEREIHNDFTQTSSDSPNRLDASNTKNDELDDNIELF